MFVFKLGRVWVVWVAGRSKEGVVVSARDAARAKRRALFFDRPLLAHACAKTLEARIETRTRPSWTRLVCRMAVVACDGGPAACASKAVCFCPVLGPAERVARQAASELKRKRSREEDFLPVEGGG